MKENIYHIYNRGTDKRKIFMDKSDFSRFLNILCFFNNARPVDFFNLSKGGSTSLSEVEPPRADERLVDILCFCLMPNHFHLILRELVEGGIATFMSKVGTGYTMYFNKRYERSGHLFQGRYKHKEINSEDGFIYLSGYIHLNPVMAKIVKDPADYKYSSYLSFLGKKEDNILALDKDVFDMSPNNYEKFIVDLRADKELLSKIENINIE
jgi:putative transposase